MGISGKKGPLWCLRVHMPVELNPQSAAVNLHGLDSFKIQNAVCIPATDISFSNNA